MQLYKHAAVFDFESYFAKQDEKLKDTEHLKWKNKHVPISVSVSSTLLTEPIFVCAK